ncbi:MAG: glycosyltransferase [Cetobacterium sp.]
MIPKKLHYIWLGNGTRPNIMDICINSWREKLPEYEIIEWNEENLDFYKVVESNSFLKKCYEERLWAFLSDYFRLQVLASEGGIYLDTDMQIIKSLDDLLDNFVFLGKESEHEVSAGIIGAVKNHPFILKSLEFYKGEIWNSPHYTIPAILQHILDTNPDLDVKLYPPDYFYPYHYTEEFSYSCITENTHGIHWWGKSWHGQKKKLYFLEFKSYRGWKKMVIDTLIFTKLLEPVRTVYEKYIKG